MQESSHTPSWYIIDVSELFTLYCSQRSIDIAITYLGGLRPLTDLCCYIALLQLRGFNPNIMDIVNEYIRTDTHNESAPPVISKVATAYTTLLRDRFVYPALFGNPVNYLNSIDIQDVIELVPLPATSDISECVSIQILASFSWQEGNLDHATNPPYRTRGIQSLPI